MYKCNNIEQKNSKYILGTIYKKLRFHKHVIKTLTNIAKLAYNFVSGFIPWVWIHMYILKILLPLQPVQRGWGGGDVNMLMMSKLIGVSWVNGS